MCHTRHALIGRRRDQQHAFFIGGSPELEDVSYLAGSVSDANVLGSSRSSPGWIAAAPRALPLNKYGLLTQTAGAVKVCHTLCAFRRKQTGMQACTMPIQCVFTACRCAYMRSCRQAAMTGHMAGQAALTNMPGGNTDGSRRGS
jgi:hypothetical protein